MDTVPRAVYIAPALQHNTHALRNRTANNFERQEAPLFEALSAIDANPYLQIL